MKKLSLILGLIATSLIAGVWYSATVYESTTVASTVTDTSSAITLAPNTDFVYLESYYSGTGYVKTTVQERIAGNWVSIISNDSTGSEYKQLTLNNMDTVRLRANEIRLINAITVSSGTSTFYQDVRYK